ncbi:MAG: ATP-binding protein [Spirochaetaceae bacterium]|jgi:signal transduction histidine kinase/response regulator of citrate/malate metabolism|nr:ATP-binding protein [Spirochaetaceae bacterium]
MKSSDLNMNVKKKLREINSFLKDFVSGKNNVILEKFSNNEIGELEVLINETIDNLNSALEKRTEELLENRATSMRMMKDAEAANISKSEFLANLSHDIRTPMNGIIGATDMIKFTEMTKDQNKFVSIISDSSRSLLNIINDILDLSKIEADKIDLEQIQMDLHQVLDKTVEMLKISAEKKGLEINLNIEKDSPRFIVGDPTRIGQIMINLVNNAIKFTKKGSITVSLQKEHEKNFVHISVSDTGIGIAQNKQMGIFEIFSQSDSSTTRRHGGTGLGLTITKKLINMMDGEITVQSELGLGSTFSFYIKTPMIDYSELRVSKKAETKKLEKKTIAVNKNLKVLVVEDHPVNMKIISFMLNKKDCHVFEAENGLIAVEKFQSIKPDLILMDMQMPVMNGLEATKEIRKLEKELGLKRTPIAALTANAMADDIEKTQKAGMDYFLAKPVTFEALAGIIDKTPVPRDQKSEIEDVSLFDYNGLVELFSGEEEITHELLNEFLKGLTPFFKKLDEYVNEELFESIKLSAHSMKGQLLNLRANEVAEKFANLERSAKEKNMESVFEGYKICRKYLEDLQSEMKSKMEGR